jgi:predicted GIY-YIG superfamily endonuclease
MNSFFYVYMLVSEIDPTSHYVGFTTDLAARLKKHREGGSPHTSKNGPRRIDVAIEFPGRQKARAIEKYLKSRSGRVFAKKHF